MAALGTGRVASGRQPGWAASMLTAAYHMLRDEVACNDLGADHFDRSDKTKLVNRLIRRVADLGFQVEIRPAA